MGNDRERDFGSVLARLRAAAGLTQEELAERSGLSARGIGNLERGTGRPRMLTMERLAAGLLLGTAAYEELAAAARRSVQAGAGIAGPATTVHQTDPLVGREAETLLVRRHVLGSAAPVLTLVGEVGIGKSRLLAEAAAIGVANNVVVLSSGCQKFGGDAYAPVVGALADHVQRTPAQVLRTQLSGCERLDLLLPEIIGLAPTCWGDSGEQRRRLMFAAAKRFLLNISGANGIVLLLDDLQWAHSDGIALIDSLVRGMAPGQLRIIAGYRDTEVPDGSPLAETAADLNRQGLLARKRLTALSHEESAILLANCPLEKRGRALRLAGGVPLHLVQLARAGGEVSWGLAAIVRQQLAALPRPTLRLIELLAVAGGPMLFERLAQVSGLRDETVARQLEPALSARLLRETVEGIEPATELVSQVVETELSGSRREVLDRRLLGQLSPEACLVNLGRWDS